MAAWHFRCAIIPKIGILKYHKRIPKYLEEYKEPDELTYKESEYYFNNPNYFNTSFIENIKNDFSTFYTPLSTWGNSISFSNERDSIIEVFPDDIECKINILDLDVEFLERIIAIAQKNDCILVNEEDGVIFNPTMENLLNQISASKKNEFLSKWKQTSQ